MRESVLKYTFIGLILLHVVVIIWHLQHAYAQIFEQRTITPEQRTFPIETGSTLNDVIERLERMDLSPSPVYVRLALARHGRQLVIKKGTYRLPETASTWDLLEIFEEGKVLLHKVTVPEGLDMWQTATLLGETQWGNEAEFLTLIESGDLIQELDPRAESLEGYLYPETYFFAEEATPEEILATMIQYFKRETEALRKELEKSKFTLRQWVAFASLIEKESSLPDERPDVSSVFHNRLKRGMLLQCDPTIIYSLKLDNRYRGKIYRSDIKYEHPYNTYVSKGLPPGPIASPGLDSLRAVLYPNETDYLYFVAKKDGSHYFSKSLREHNRAVRKYLRNR